MTISTGQVVQQGFIDGDPLVYDLQNRTIANSNGSVTLGSNIVFVGSDYAIIASENINFGTATTINLSNGSGNGGNLTMIAGYDFTPSTSGTEESNLAFTLGGHSTNGGSIDMTGVTINLSGSNNGGSLLAVAQGQAGGNAGTVVLGTVNTTGAAGIGGSVTVLGSGGITTGAIDATGGTTSGEVLLNVYNTHIVFGDVIITNGTRSGAGVFVTESFSNGNLSFGDIDASLVQLTGAFDALSTVNGTGTITATNLLVQTGDGVATIGTTDVDVLGSTSNGTGTVSLSNTGDLSLNGIFGGHTLTVDATGTISNSSPFTVGTLNLDSSIASGTAISLASGTTATNGATLTSSGGGNILRFARYQWHFDSRLRR